jgi:hypothetical protein
MTKPISEFYLVFWTKTKGYVASGSRKVIPEFRIKTYRIQTSSFAHFRSEKELQNIINCTVKSD